MELIFLAGNIPMEWGQIILKHVLKTPKLLPALNDKFMGGNVSSNIQKIQWCTIFLTDHNKINADGCKKSN